MGSPLMAAGFAHRIEAHNQWIPHRRGVDYYPEGTLIWLDADVIIPAVE